MFAFLQSLSRRLEPETTVENLSVTPSPAPPLDAKGLEELDAAIEDLFEASGDAPDGETHRR